MSTTPNSHYIYPPTGSIMYQPPDPITYDNLRNARWWTRLQALHSAERLITVLMQEPRIDSATCHVQSTVVVIYTCGDKEAHQKDVFDISKRLIFNNVKIDGANSLWEVKSAKEAGFHFELSEAAPKLFGKGDTRTDRRVVMAVDLGIPKLGVRIDELTNLRLINKAFDTHQLRRTTKKLEAKKAKKTR